MRKTEQSHPTAIFLMGPTGAGKTVLAMKLALQCQCEIISVDSGQIYKQMDIGTAKATTDELQKVPHALVNIIDPLEYYSAGDFRKDALCLMKEITERGNTPLLVGGTMLYYKALIDGLSPLPSADQSIRKAIQNEALLHGWEYLHKKLYEIDPTSAKRIHVNDPQRLSRALEVYRISGKSMTELTSIKRAKIPYNIKQFALAPQDKKTLHERIELRFKLMLENGFESEVKALYQRGDLHPKLPSMRCVGYRQMWEYLAGSLDHDEMIFRAIVATKQLAKKQMTWLKGWEEVSWLRGSDKNNFSIIENIIALA